MGATIVNSVSLSAARALAVAVKAYDARLVLKHSRGDMA
jgi:hypothetical protein